MTTRPYELLVCFSSDGSIRGASVRYITTVNGRDYEGDPIPLQGVDDPAFATFAEQFSAAAIAERDTARAELATMTEERNALASSLAEMTTARDDAWNARDALTLELQTANELIAQDNIELASNTQAIAEAQLALDKASADLDAATAEIARLTAEIEELRNPPNNPRHLAPFDFAARFTDEELYNIETSTDEVVVVQRAKLKTVISYVDLDSPSLQQLVYYLERASVIAPGRAAQILS